MGNTTTLINFLIKLQNATNCKNFSFVEEKYSNKIIKILKLLIDMGCIRAYSVEGINKNKKIRVILKYKINGEPIFNKIKIISKPGTVYHLTNSLISKQIHNFAGICIFSTSEGFLTSGDLIKKGLGGILLYKFYY
jgi:ribosomal protein S8